VLRIGIFCVGALAFFMVLYHGHEPTRQVVLGILGIVVVARLTALVSRIFILPSGSGASWLLVSPAIGPLLHRRLVGLAREIMRADAAVYGNQFPAYREDPMRETLRTVEGPRGRRRRARQYGECQRLMVYGERPEFEMAIGMVETLAAHFCENCIANTCRS